MLRWLADDVGPDGAIVGIDLATALVLQVDLRKAPLRSESPNLSRLCDPQHPQFALRRPDFHFLQTFTVVVGER